MSCNKTALNVLMLLFVLALGLSAAHLADAKRPTVKIVKINAEALPEDNLVDGEVETFSADYMVYADGKAVGRIQLAQADIILIDNGKIDLDQKKSFIVSIDPATE